MIHLVGLPHTQFTVEDGYTSCAFTAKAVRLVSMLRSVGRDVTTYWGGDLADVSLMSVEDQLRYFGPWSPDILPVVQWDVTLPYWREFNSRAVQEIQGRIEPGDIVAVVGGSISQSVIDTFKDDYTCVEPGVGYEGICRDTFCCFESYAWMHNRYGWAGINNGRAFDVVIPNAVHPNEWEVGPSEGYALFVGRLVQRKGPHVAGQIAAAAGLPLKLAGAGVAKTEPGRITATDGTIVAGDVEHVGAVTGAERTRLFSCAEVLLCPTLYIGPWEGVHAEALMSGVPVVAPDYGAFTETIPEAYRYRTLKQAVSAVGAGVRGEVWREYATSLCSPDVCAARYADWFDRLDSIRDGRNGWYA